MRAFSECSLRGVARPELVLGHEAAGGHHRPRGNLAPLLHHGALGYHRPSSDAAPGVGGEISTASGIYGECSKGCFVGRLFNRRVDYTWREHIVHVRFSNSSGIKKGRKGVKKHGEA